MSTFVLVHGAWHGGWCWERVAMRLAAAGHRVLTPTLTGLAERAPLLSRDVGLDTHVADVLAVLETGQLQHAVLVGHSYGGVVITAVSACLDPAARRVARLVHLDAVVPRHGQGLLDCIHPKLKARFEDETTRAGDGWFIPAHVPSAEFLGLKDEADIAWVLPRLTPQPMRTFRDRVDLTRGVFPPARTYVNCIGDKPFGQARSRLADGIEDYHELRTGHDAMVTAPREVAELLLAAVPE